MILNFNLIMVVSDGGRSIDSLRLYYNSDKEVEKELTERTGSQRFRWRTTPKILPWFHCVVSFFGCFGVID